MFRPKIRTIAEDRKLNNLYLFSYFCLSQIYFQKLISYCFTSNIFIFFSFVFYLLKFCFNFRHKYFINHKLKIKNAIYLKQLVVSMLRVILKDLRKI